MIRINVADEAGMLAKIASVFGENDVSIKSVLQHGEGGEFVPMIFVTHAAHENDIRSALDKIQGLEGVGNIESCIRVEE